jgi:hypothetical protein
MVTLDFVVRGGNDGVHEQVPPREHPGSNGGKPDDSTGAPQHAELPGEAASISPI